MGPCKNIIIFFILYSCSTINQAPSLEIKNKICFFGDSHAAEPNPSLKNTMANTLKSFLLIKNDLSWNAKIGYSAISWVDDDLKNKIMGCNTIIFELADNMFSWMSGKPRHPGIPPVMQSYIDKSALSVREAIGDRRCIWIGPAYGGVGPLYRKTNADLNAMYKALKISLDKINCVLIDSRGDFHYEGPDGLHYKPGKESEAWGMFVVEKLKQILQ